MPWGRGIFQGHSQAGRLFLFVFLPLIAHERIHFDKSLYLRPLWCLLSDLFDICQSRGCRTRTAHMGRGTTASRASRRWALFAQAISLAVFGYLPLFGQRPMLHHL